MEMQLATAYESLWRQEWLSALHKGDCLQIEDLLMKDEGLVTIFPRSEPCPNALEFAALFKGWRGCSALHVAVKRGWPFLVQKIVNLFTEDPQPSNTSNQSLRKSEVSSLSKDKALADPSQQDIAGPSTGADVGHEDPTPVNSLEGPSQVEIEATIAGISAGTDGGHEIPVPVHEIDEVSREEPQLSRTSNQSLRKSKDLSLSNGKALADPSQVEIEEEVAVTSAGAAVSRGDPTPVAGRKGLNMTMLQELLLAFDSHYHLDALALAVVNGNETIVRILASASSNCRNNPFGTDIVGLRPYDAVDRSATGFEQSDYENGENENLREPLMSIIEEVLPKFYGDFEEAVSQDYSQDPAYNFLPWQLFFCHHCAVRRKLSIVEDIIMAIMEELRKRDDGWKLMKYMFSLKDGRGKTLAHVAAQHLKYLPSTTRHWSEDERGLFLQVRDGAGRTVAHEFVDALIPDHESDREHVREVIQYFINSYRSDFSLLVKELNHVCTRQNSGLFEYFDLEALYVRNGYPHYRVYPYRPVIEKERLHQSSGFIHAALHNGLQFFIDNSFLPNWSQCYYRMGLAERRRPRWAELTILEVAALCGIDSVMTNFLKKLLEDDEFCDIARVENRSPPRPDVSILFMAAAFGEPGPIQAILASRKFDPLIRDPRSGNTALHFAVDGENMFSGLLLKPHLLDLVDVSHKPGRAMPHMYRFSRAEETAKEKEFIQAAESKRKGCINLLLQAGIDIWQENKTGNIAEPGKNASADFCLWWYERLDKETRELKSSLNSAANAISVTAALVATASFVGPLQPPLGYGSNEDRVQVENLSVRIFIVCDTLALYFSLTAILLSLKPLLPLPQVSMLDELAHVRKVVNWAVVFLTFSVVLFLIGFAAGSIAVIPNNNSWNHGGLTISTIIVGGMCIFYVLYLFAIHLARLVFPRHTWLRRNYIPMTLFCGVKKRE